MKWKNTVAVALVSAMALGVPVYAADEKAANTTPVYTFEEVLERATKNNSDLALLEENLDLLSRQSQNLSQGLGGEVYPSDPGDISNVTEQYQTLRQLNSIMVERQASRYTREALEKQLEYSVMSAMTTIVTNEATLANATQQRKLYEDQLRLAQTRLNLGMGTQLDVDQAQARIQQYETDLETAQSDVDQAYADLARLMGIRSTEFEIVYEPAYEPFELNTDLDTYLSRKNSTNPTLQGAEYSVEELEKSKNFTLANSTSPYGYDELMYQINQAKSTLKQSYDAFEKIGEATYAGIEQAEGTIAMLETNLDLAESNLKVAQLNLQTGTGTQLALEEAQNTVDTTKNSLQAAKLNHSLLVYQMENPCVAAAQ